MEKLQTVRMRIKTRYRDMSVSDKLIADYVLSNMQFVSTASINEIAEELNTTEMIIYRDLTKRALIMEEIDSNLKRQILLRLQDHKNYNLTKGR